MSLRLLLAMLLRYWLPLLLGTNVGALAALGVSSISPERYEAVCTVVLSSPKIAEPLDRATYLESRMPTYAELSTSRPVLDGATRTLGISVPRDVLARKVVAFVPESTSLIILTAEGSDPQSAAELANAVAESFAGLAPRLDNPDRPVLQVDILEPALPPAEPAGLSIVVRLAIGAVLGATAVMLAALAHATLKQ